MEKHGGSTCPAAAGLALWRGWLCSSHRNGQPGQPLSGACFLASKRICDSDRFGRRQIPHGETVPRRKSFIVLVGWRCRFVVCAMEPNLLVRLIPTDVPRTEEIRLDGGVLGFTFATSLLVGLLFGLTPRFAFWRSDVNGSLKPEARGSTGSI